MMTTLLKRIAVLAVMLGVSASADWMSALAEGIFIITVLEVTNPRKWAARIPREISDVRA